MKRRHWIWVCIFSLSNNKFQFTILLCHTILFDMLWRELYFLPVTLKCPPISFLIKYFKHEVEHRHNYNQNLCTATQPDQILPSCHICFKYFLLKINIVNIRKLSHEFLLNSTKITILLNFHACFFASNTCLHP